MSARVMEIVVRGRLGPEFIATLAAYAVHDDEDGRTRIVAPMADQSELLGLLGLLDRFHIEVISVNPVAPRQEGFVTRAG